MENFGIDYVLVRSGAFVLNGRHDQMGRIFSELQTFNIDSCISSKQLNRLSVVILPEDEKDHRKLTELLEQSGVVSDFLSPRDCAYIEFGGHFMGGSLGLLNMALEVMRRRKINIEYQIVNPSRYSIVVKPRQLDKAIRHIISDLGVRDSMVTIQ